MLLRPLLKDMLLRNLQNDLPTCMLPNQCMLLKKVVWFATKHWNKNMFLRQCYSHAIGQIISYRCYMNTCCSNKYLEGYLLIWCWIKSCCQAAQVHHDHMFVHRWCFHWWPCVLVQGVVEGLQGPFLANPAFQATASTPLPDQIAIQIFAIPMVAFVFHTFSMASAKVVLQTVFFLFPGGAAMVHGWNLQQEQSASGLQKKLCLHLLSQTKQEATWVMLVVTGC